MEFKRIVIDKTPFIHIVPKSNIIVSEELEDISKRLIFNIKTYDKLSKSTNYLFTAIIKKPINRFFEFLSQEEKNMLFAMFCKIKFNIENHLSIDFNDVIENIASIIRDTFNQCNLVEKIREYIKSDKEISFPDFSKKVLRPQDSPEKTFVESEYIDLTALSIICKLLFPVFGDIIGIYFKRSSEKTNNADKLFKERFSMGILKYIFEDHFKELIDKLKFYISNEIRKRRDISDSINGLFKGFTINNVNNHILAALFIKKFVNIDFYCKGGDMMVYILVCTKCTLNSIIGGFKNKNEDTIKERFTPSDFPEKFKSDDNKKSNLEVESFNFDYSIDIPVLSRIGMFKLIKDKLEEFQVDEYIYNDVVSFYENNIIHLNPVNILLVSAFFAKELGSVIGVQMANINVFIKAVSFLQIYMINTGYKSLIHLLSIIPQTKIKTIKTSIDNKIIITKGQGLEYRVCKDNFVLLDNFYSWDNYITKTICNFIVNSFHTFNTSPTIWNIIGEENKNGQDFEYDDQIINDIYKFIAHLLE